MSTHKDKDLRTVSLSSAAMKLWHDAYQSLKVNCLIKIFIQKNCLLKLKKINILTQAQTKTIHDNQASATEDVQSNTLHKGGTMAVSTMRAQ